MLEGHDVIAFSYSDWRASWSTPQQLMSRVASPPGVVPQTRVLYVDQPRSFLYGLKPADPQGAGVWSGDALQEVQPNLWVLHPAARFLPLGGLPFAVARGLLALNGRLLARQVRAAATALRLRDPVLWSFSPLHAGAVTHVPHALHLYDIADDWVNYVKRPAGRALVTWAETWLCRNADLVLPSTNNIQKKWIDLNPNSHVVPHAADFAHFSKAADPATVVPADIASLPRPIIGSVGVIDPDRFDVELIEYLSTERPEWSIVLVGPPRADMDLTRLEKRPNVYLTGNRVIADLPNYLKGMDVTLVPYRINEATKNIYPLKLQEYLATGKPVVSSAMPSILPFEGPVRIARSHGEFVSAIEAALAEDGPCAGTARQQVARENSWEGRVADKLSWIEKTLKQKEALA